jgi:aminopeptidase N
VQPARRSFLLPESRVHFERPRPFHVEHYIIVLRVDFEKREIEGSCTLKVSTIKPKLQTLSLDAVGLKVTAAELDGKPCPFENDGQLLTLRPASTLDGVHEVEVRYSASPEKGLYFVGPDARHPGRKVEAWTHSEPEAARYWFPCFDYPNDKSTSETIITVPEGNVVISNGRLLDSNSENGWTTFHWKEGASHATYLTSFVAGRFSLLEETVGGVDLQYYYPKEREKDVKRLFGETPTVLRFLEEVTQMEYPYEKYAQITVHDFIAGGEENISASTLTTDYYPDKRSDSDFQVSYTLPANGPAALVAHELAHQWFGDLVTCRSWSHIWLSESFAVYFEALFNERLNGKDYFRWEMSLMAEDFFDEDQREYRRPIVENRFVYPEDVFDSTAYQKGAWMLHELRFLIGDDAFFTGIAKYLKDFAGKVVDTHDFMRVMEEASGSSLEGFFGQAFYTSGYPELKVSYEWDEERDIALMNVKQIRKDSENPVFSFPAQLVFYTKTGRRLFRVEVAASDQTFAAELDSRPEVVEFDPQNWILKKHEFPKTFDLLYNQLARSEDASSRAEAASELGKMKNPCAIPVLEEAMKRSQFWGVNAAAIRALGEIGTPEALDVLLREGPPEHARVRRAWAAALGFFKDERASIALEKTLLSDESPYVQCEAALSLTKCGHVRALEALKKAMKFESPNNTLTEACLESFGRLRGEEVDAMLFENLRFGRPTRARIGALKGIKERGRLSADELRIIVDIIVKDREYKVRQYALLHLVRSIPDLGFLDALREVSISDADNRLRRLALDAYYYVSGTTEDGHSLSQITKEVAQLRDDISGMRVNPSNIQASAS